MTYRHAFLILIIVLLAFMPSSCGRKKPPLPPRAPDPVEIISIKFSGEKVVAKIRCNAKGDRVILLGKPKGICPHCTEDLKEIVAISADTTRKLVLEDVAPKSHYMVYRIALDTGGSFWLTEPAIVSK
ncbi:MAG: hypothetical protein U9P49_10440 [Thermodesulfobacteriota bacterium]|nr:hypothetical protein [Thermodesulfobacteriota bacterium]